MLVLSAVLALSGCASSVAKVTNPNAPTMEQVYDQYTGADTAKVEDRHAVLLRRPATDEKDLQLGLPPFPERLAHLYPELPNPELYMYVRPHAVGVSGSPIPAYITRFRMYERQPYALPGETLNSLKTQVDDRLAHPHADPKPTVAPQAQTKPDNSEDNSLTGSF